MTSIKELQKIIDQRFMVIPLEKLKQAPWNFKKDDNERTAKLVKNVQCNGQIKNCNVRELKNGLYEIIDGNHRLPAYQELGFEGAICYNHGRISQAEAIRLAHEVTEYFEIDTLKQNDALNLMVREIDLSELAETTAFDVEELENIKALADFDWETLEKPESVGKKDKYNIKFSVSGEEALRKVMDEIERLIQVNDLASNESGRGQALEKMAERSSEKT